MNVVLFGSELDKDFLDIAGHLKEHFDGLRTVVREDANGLLHIEDGDVILDLAPGMDKPVLLGKEELVSGSPATLNGGVLGPFLNKMEKIGRLSDVRVIGVPLQIDESVVSSVESLLNELKK